MSRRNRGNGRNLFACHLSLISFLPAGQLIMSVVFLCPAEIAEMAEISFISILSAGQQISLQFLCPAEIAEMAEISFISFISAGQQISLQFF